MTTKKKFNKKVVIQSLLALICLALSYFVSYWFFLPIVYFIWSNQKELTIKK